MNTNQLIAAFRLSPAIQSLEVETRDQLMGMIESGDLNTISQLSVILEKEKKLDTGIDAVAQKVVEETVHKLLQMDRLKTLHASEVKSSIEDAVGMDQVIENLNKL